MTMMMDQLYMNGLPLPVVSFYRDLGIVISKVIHPLALVMLTL